MQRLDKQAWLKQEGTTQDGKQETGQHEWVNYTAWGVDLPKVVLKCSRWNLLPSSYVKWAYAQIIGWDQDLLQVLYKYCPVSQAVDADDNEGVPELLLYDASDSMPAGKHGTWD